MIAINNSLNNLLGYPATNGNEEWPKFISVARGEVARIFDKWRGKSPLTSPKSQRYFDDLLQSSSLRRSMLRFTIGLFIDLNTTGLCSTVSSKCRPAAMVWADGPRGE